MHALTIAFGATLITLSAGAQNPEAPAPSGPAATAASEMLKYLAEGETRWRGLLANEVTKPADLELRKAQQAYQAAVEAKLAEATTAGNLDAAVLWRQERDLFASSLNVPAEDDVRATPGLRKLRDSFRVATARLARDRAEKTKALLHRYDAELAQAQVLLTQRQRLDDALLVKNQREMIANLAPPPPATPASLATPYAPMPTATPGVTTSPAPLAKRPATPTPDATTTRRLAKVEVADTVLARLAKGEPIWSDRGSIYIESVPARYRDFQFTQFPAHAQTLNFKVLTDGPVILGCSARWGTTASPADAKTFTDEARLLEQGWERRKGEQIDTTAQDMQFLHFTRECKAGEHFSYRTDKYAPPILVFKKEP